MSIKKMMSIEEVDEVLSLQEKTSKKLAYVVLVAIGYFWAVGFGLPIMLYQPGLSYLLSLLSSILGGLAGYMPIIVTAIAIVFLLMFAAAIIFLKLIAKFAKEFLMAVHIMGSMFILIFGLMSFAAPYAEVWVIGALYIGLGVLALISSIMQRRRIILVGRLIEVSGRAVYDEKGTILAVLVKSLLIFLTSIAFIITEVLTVFFAIEVFQGYEYGSYIVVAIANITAIFYSWAITFIDVFFSAVIVRIIHDWYRSPELDVASFSKGLSKAWEVSGTIAKYSLLMAILYFVVRRARREAQDRKIGFAAKSVALAAGISVAMLEFLGFYLIPAAVIRRAGFKKSLKDSIDKLRGLFIETLIGMYGFGFTLAMCAFIAALLMGGIGWIIGVAIFTPLLGLTEETIRVGIITGVAFLLLTPIPIAFATSAVSVAFKTIMYEYGLDIEFAIRGMYLPSRLPEDVRKIFNETLARKGLQIPQMIA
ncbi:MAG: choline transporter-like family protein [Crenarchaeota archaeon]|nr:choline transporter-like family protein [Thermoproteota archaeon]